MGFKEGNFPPVEPEEFLRRPLMERVQTLSLHWVEYGFGTAKMIHTVYLVKLAVLYLLGGIGLATWTSGAGAFWQVGEWWNQPIVWQKLVVWTAMLEAIGLAGSWGPLAGKFKPMTGGALFWARTGTFRMPPWAGTVPLTAGNRRTPLDVVLYVGFVVSLAVAFLAPGVDSDSLSAVVPSNTSGVINPALLVAPIVLWLLVGLRDKIVFLAARGEQYLPALVIFAVFDFTDMIVAAKLLIVCVWVGAGVSKIGHHFVNVIPPMISNSPAILSTRVRRAFYRDFPNDVRPSKLAWFFGHVLGTFVEIAIPLVLLFSTNRTITLLAVVSMVIFHLFITSTFPLAVPLEWNLLFSYLTVFLFMGFPAWEGYGIGAMSSPVLTVVVIAALVTFPILGNLRPDLVSFLPSMRQYAGNWASALWTFSPGAEAKLNNLKNRPTVNQVDQMQAMGYAPEIAEITMQQTIGWRSLHSQGRGLFSVLIANLGDVDERTVREAEFGCNSIIGFNFGDGHLHDPSLIAAVQSEVGFEPGEWIVVWVESQAIHSPVQHYQVIDAALGVIERGTWRVADAVNAQPWLPDGPIALEVTWRHPDGWPVAPPAALQPTQAAQRTQSTIPTTAQRSDAHEPVASSTESGNERLDSVGT